MKERLVFASIVYSTRFSEANALLLAESVRAFGGSLAQFPILYFTPKNRGRFSESTRDKLASLNVEVLPFDVDSEVLDFPLAGDVFAAAAAESATCNQTDILAWLGTNTVVLQEPKSFILSKEKKLGFRPVHHTLVGSRYDKPADEFWTLVYRYCKVPQNRIFPMMTHVDGTRIRPYFNAGILITRPEENLLQTWKNTFSSLYQESSLQEFYRKNELYQIFIHQALLSGVILSKFEGDELVELPSTYNYPLHLYAEDVSGNRPSSLEEVVTFRHEGFYRDKEWMNKVPAKQRLKRWLSERITV